MFLGLTRASQKCHGCFWGQSRERDMGIWYVFCRVLVECGRPIIRG